MNGDAIIFGGSGYIGAKLAEHLRSRGWRRILLADVKAPIGPLSDGVEYIACDVSREIVDQISVQSEDWIFNFAAIHREPGHAFREYFDTNLPGARNVCVYATHACCQRIVFTSSIAVYGEILTPTAECVPTYPVTAYGTSKLCAELIHEAWQRADAGRRLIIVRPGVVYGPGDPGNILRLIRAIQKGLFVMPGKGSVQKSYAYIYGLIESIEFMMCRSERYLCYNYVEKETESLSTLAAIIATEFGLRRPRLRIPKSLLVAIAHMAQFVTVGRSQIHPVRVRKAARSTHIVPGELIRLGFKFPYNFNESLRHWRHIAPEDFAERLPVKR